MEELKNSIIEELEKKNVFEDKYQVKGYDEEKLKDDLLPKLENFYTDVQREVSIQDCGLIADFTYFNNKLNVKEVMEVKIGEASAPDFVQLLGYLITSDIKNGVLLAKSFNDNVINLSKDVSKKFAAYGISVRLEPISKFF